MDTMNQFIVHVFENVTGSRAMEFDILYRECAFHSLPMDLQCKYSVEVQFVRSS